MAPDGAAAQQSPPESWLVAACDYISLSRNQATLRNAPEGLDCGQWAGPLASFETPNLSPKISRCSSVRSSVAETPRVAAEGAEASQSGRGLAQEKLPPIAFGMRRDSGQRLVMQLWKRLRGCGVLLTKQRQLPDNDGLTGDDDAPLCALQQQQGQLSSCVTSYNIKVRDSYLISRKASPGQNAHHARPEEFPPIHL
jgi:hypothetical protein